MTLQTPIDSSSPPRSARPKWLVILLLLVGAGALIFYFAILPRLDTTPGFGPINAKPANSGAHTVFTGSGASFPYPYYAKLFAEYSKLRPAVQIKYTSVGSSMGIKQISEQATDFGASDAPMSDAELKAAKGGAVLHIPLTLGAVVPIYNVPGVDKAKPLIFSGPVLADIFCGVVTKWNDPALTALNPGIELPATEISIVHRTDGSGTTYIFSEYLSKVSEDFAKTPGKGTVVDWPAVNKQGANGSDGVAGVVSKTPGTIGYIELTYALQNKIAFGGVVNAAGKAIHANLRSVTAAAASRTKPPADLRMSITNASGDSAYPISAFSYLLVYKDQSDRAKADALADFLVWAVTDGQSLAPQLQYAPLPTDIAAIDQRVILSLTVNGKPFASEK